MKEAQARPSEMLDDILMPKTQTAERKSIKNSDTALRLYGLNLLLTEK